MRYKILTLLLFVTSCNLSTHPTPTSTPANTLVPTVMVAQISTATDMPVPIPEREKYTLNTIINYDLHFVIVDEKILYPNHTGQQLNSLTLAVAANLWQNCFKLATIKVDDIPIMDYTLTAQRLDITLLTPLEPDSILTVTLGYSLSLPYMDQAHSLRARIFGYSDVQMNLVNWYPFIVPFKDGAWIIREPWSHGEYLVYPIANFEVNLKFANPENMPTVAASGFAEPNGESTRYTLTEARTFAISASREFEVSHMKIGNTTVYSYYLPIYKRAGEAAMIASAQAIQVFTEVWSLFA